jgi:hypothetical protein
MPDETNPPDIADILAAEAEEWLGRMGATGTVPRAFIAVTAREERLIARLLEVDVPQAIRVDFLQWLCRATGVSAYAYISQVTDETGRESASITASSLTRDVALTLAITRGADQSITYSRTYGEARPAGSFEHGLYFGLHRAPHTGQDADTSRDAEFAAIWANWHSKIWQLGPRAVN